MKKIFLIHLILFPLLSLSQTNFNYKWGITSSLDLLRPYPEKKNQDIQIPIGGGIYYEYFTSSYSNGVAINLGLTNQLNYKKLFIKADFGYNYATQVQTVVFSNTVDLNISHVVRHHIPHCSFDVSLGRDFNLKHDRKLQIELGFNTIFSMKIGPYQFHLEKSDTINSIYSDEEYHYSEGWGYEKFDAHYDYQRPTTVAPFLKIGIQKPIGNNYLTFGFSAKLKRLAYENFIYLNSDTFSAVASSRSNSPSLGVYLNYQFGVQTKKKKNWERK